MAKGSKQANNKAKQHSPSLGPKAAPLKHLQKPHAAQAPKHAARQQQRASTAPPKPPHGDEETAHRRRALQRMEMGPSDSDSGDMSSEDGAGVLHEQQANGRGATNSEHESYLRALRRMEMGPSDEEQGSSSEGEEESSEEGAQQRGGGKAQGSSGQDGSVGESEEGSSESEDDDEMEEGTGMAGKGGRQQLGSEQLLQGRRQAADEDRDRLKGMGYYEGNSEGSGSGASTDGSSGSEDDDEGDGRAEPPRTKQQQQQQGGGGSGESSSGSDQSEGGEDEEAAFLAELPLGERLALRTDGSGPGGTAAREAAAKAREAERNFKRPNKHRPQEASSKKPVPRLREVIKPAHKPGRDPRFAPVFNPAEKDQAAKRYSFVFDDVLPEDRNRLRNQLKQTRNECARAALSTQLQRVEQSLRQEQERRRNEKIESEWKAKERTALQSGAKTKPFFLKKGEKKKMALTARFQELKEKGQLDKYMEKRRKRNASKDHKKFPGSL